MCGTLTDNEGRHPKKPLMPSLMLNLVICIITVSTLTLARICDDLKNILYDLVLKKLRVFAVLKRINCIYMISWIRPTPTHYTGSPKPPGQLK